VYRPYIDDDQCKASQRRAHRDCYDARTAHHVILSAAPIVHHHTRMIARAARRISPIMRCGSARFFTPRAGSRRAGRHTCVPFRMTLCFASTHCNSACRAGTPWPPASIRVDLLYLGREPVADLFDVVSVWEEGCKEL